MLVHCGGGKGRAGTFAACCLAMWGWAAPPHTAAEKPVMSAQEAVRHVRSLRPGSIETQEQEAFVQVCCLVLTISHHFLGRHCCAALAKLLCCTLWIIAARMWLSTARTCRHERTCHH